MAQKNGTVKILGISGSPRHGNTEILLNETLNAAKTTPNIATELITLADLNIAGGCTSTYLCWEKKDGICHCYDDDVNLILEKMVAADAIIIGTPVFFGTLTGQLKSLLDRTLCLGTSEGPPLGYAAFKNKVGAAVVVAIHRQGGHQSAVAAIHQWFFIQSLIVVGVGPKRDEIAGYEGAMALQGWPNPIFSQEPGELDAVKQDTWGLYAARSLGQRVARLTTIIHNAPPF